ncbi:MAG: NAD(+)/NADH kinase [Chloroflexota bacterium]
MVNRVGILYHPMVEATQVKARELQEFLCSSGISVWLCSAWETEAARAQLNDTGLLITVGGDGTILRAVQVAVPGETPIVGVNLGRLGFLTELSAGEAREKLPSLLAGEGWVDERAMLEAEVSSGGREHRAFRALNDVVVARGAIARLVHVAAAVDGQPLASYKADGVIVATATGSTGYSLAAGGPVLYPQSRDFLLVPVAPHLSPRHAVVVPPTAVVSLRLVTVYEATMSIDGHINLPLASGDVITVRHSTNTVRFLRVQPEASFYSSLERKLGGKK